MSVRRGNLLTAGLVVAALVTGMWAHARAQTPPTIGTIVLAMVGNVCEKTVIGNDPVQKNRLHTRQGRDVIFNVSNQDCPKGVEVFIKDADWSPSNPFGPGVNLNCRTNGSGYCKMQSRAKANPGTYSYAVWVGTYKTKDPDLIIDPN